MRETEGGIMNRRRFLALALILALILPLAGCDDRLTRACQVLRAGRHTLEVWAYPALDVAAGLPIPPEWVAVYRPARAALEVVLARLEGVCVRAEREGGVTYDDVAPTIAEASVMVAQLLTIWTEAQAAGTVPSPRSTTMPDVDQLLADLERVRGEAAREMGR